MKSAVDLYFAQIRNIPLLTQEEELRLINQAQKGSLLARNELIKHNLKLVVYVVRTRFHAAGMSTIDLISEGNFGLIPAIRKFDPTKGMKFSTYAVIWIRQRISRSIIDKEYTIRIPVHLHEKQKNYLRFVEKFEILNGREPTEEEVKKALKLPDKTYDAIQASLISCTSLDVPVKTDGESEGILYGEIPDEAKKEEKIDFTHKDFSILSPRELDMMQLKYGFTGRPHTLQEIANKYDMSRERVRQIIMDALKHLRTSDYIREFYQKEDK